MIGSRMRFWNLKPSPPPPFAAEEKGRKSEPGPDSTEFQDHDGFTERRRSTFGMFGIGPRDSGLSIPIVEV